MQQSCSTATLRCAIGSRHPVTLSAGARCGPTRALARGRAVGTTARFSAEPDDRATPPDLRSHDRRPPFHPERLRASGPRRAASSRCSITAGRKGLIPLWVGEGDLPTPAFICRCGHRSLAAGETFYTYQRGIPELREALARYHDPVYGNPRIPERFFVTVGGMQAIQIAIRMTAGGRR